jgi:DNA polymerase III delta subunit
MTEAKISRAYLLKGDDDFQKQQVLEKLLSEVVTPDFADFDFEQLEGDCVDSDRIINALSVMPFGSTRRTVLIRYANKMDPVEQERLAELLPTTPESACLIMVTPAPEKIDNRPRKGSEVIGALSTAIRKVGQVLDIGGGQKRDKTDAARKFALTVFNEAGKKIAEPALGAFLSRVGSDFSVINTEAQKLIDYSGDTTQITSDDVAAVTSETPEEKIFKLIDSIGARDKPSALRNLSDMMGDEESARGNASKTLATIARHFRLLWQMRFLMEHNVRELTRDGVPENLQSALPSQPNLLDLLSRQAWMKQRLLSQCRHFSEVELARAFAAIERADFQLKGTEGENENPSLVMELLVLDLVRQ